MLREAPVAVHRVDQFAAHYHVERATLPWDQLDLGQLMPEPLHERLGQRQRLRLIATLGAVGDRDFYRAYRHSSCSSAGAPENKKRENMAHASTTYDSKRHEDSHYGAATHATLAQD